ncbi:MAG TPA: RecX family transcriptional regulator [Bryobacteraceae bacterium]
MKPLDIEGLMNYAARALSARAYSVSELATRLKKRAARPEDVDEVLDRLKRGGVLNDRRLAGSFAEWRRESQGMGKQRVMRDLMHRRVAPAVAKEAVEAAYEGSDEPAMIRAFLERKFRGKDLGALLKEQKNLASVFRRLRGAGFSTANSIRVLKNYAAEAEQLDEIDDDVAAP